MQSVTGIPSALVIAPSVLLFASGCEIPRETIDHPTSEPVLDTLWSISGRDPALLLSDRIVADVAASGAAVIGDRVQQKIFVLSPTGHLQTKFGQEGPGPAEFKLINDVALVDNSGILISDSGNQRLTLWSLDGELENSTRFPPESQSLFLLRSRAGVMVRTFAGYDLDDPSFSLRRLAVPRLEYEGTPLIIDTGMQNEPDSRVSCTTCPVVLLDDGRLATSPGTSAGTLVVMSPGDTSLTRLSESLPVVPPYSAEEWQDRQARRWDSFVWRLQTLGSYVPQRPRDWGAPEERPWVEDDGMGVDHRGRLWILRSTVQDGRTILDVIEADGAYLTDVVIDGMEARWLRSRGSKLLLSGLDSYGVPWVKVMSISD